MEPPTESAPIVPPSIPFEHPPGVQLVAPGTKSAQPAAPRDGRANFAGGEHIIYSWQAPIEQGDKPITSYVLTIAQGSDLPITHTLDVSQSFYTLYNFNKEAQVAATVKASNDNGQTFGPEFVFPTMALPKAPTHGPASVEATIVEPGHVKISWTAPAEQPEGQASYFVNSQSSNPSDPSIGFISRDLTDTFCHIRELNTSSEYTFSVGVRNNAGESPAVSTVTVKFI
jgi:hypothetical protein